MVKADNKAMRSPLRLSTPADLRCQPNPGRKAAVQSKSCPYHIVMACFLGGQVLMRILRGKVNRQRTLEQMVAAGPFTLTPVLLTNLFAGMIFTIQTARELERFGAMHALGGAFAMAFCRELAPILTAGIMAGQVGTAYAAEIGCMKVTDQIDALKVLRTDPIDYLVVPRVVACCVMLPALTVMGLVLGLAGGAAVAFLFYQMPVGQFLDSVRSLMMLNDLIAVLLKSVLFGVIVALAGCTWGLTTTCSRSVGRAATSAVVTTWVGLFVVDFFLSLLLFGGGDIAPH